MLPTTKWRGLLLCRATSVWYGNDRAGRAAPHLLSPAPRDDIASRGREYYYLLKNLVEAIGVFVPPLQASRRILWVGYVALLLGLVICSLILLGLRP